MVIDVSYKHVIILVKKKEKMVKRGVMGLVSIVLLLLLATTTLADYSEEIINDTIFSGEGINVDDYSLIITMNYDETRIFVDAGDDFASINREDCGHVKNLEVCFLNVTFDEEELRTYIDVSVYRNKPEIYVDRTVSSTEFSTGSEQTMIVTFGNLGDPATEVTYYERWGNNFEITEDVDGPCMIEGTAIIWKGFLEPDKEKVCEFKFKAKNSGNYGSVGTVRYFDGFETKRESSTELMLIIKDIVEMKYRITHEGQELVEKTLKYYEVDETPEEINIAVGEKFNLALLFENTYEEEKSVDGIIKIDLPESLFYEGSGTIITKVKSGTNWIKTKVDTTSSMRKKDKSLEWTGTFNTSGTPNAIKSFILEIDTNKVGSIPIMINGEFEDENGNIYNYKKILNVNVIDKGMKATLYINDLTKRFEREEFLSEDEDSIDVESNNEYRFKLQLENLNWYNKLKDVKIIFDTELIQLKNVNYATIEEGARIIPYSFIFVTPLNTTKTRFDLNILFKYKTEQGECFTNETKFFIDVNSFKNLTINHEFEETKIFGDEKTSLSVFVDNNRLIDIKKVTVEEVIDPSIKVKGITSRTLNIKAEEEIEVYTYELTAPLTEEQKKLPITTKVSYFDEDYNKLITVEKTSYLEVEPKEYNLQIERTLEEDYEMGAVTDISYLITNSEDEEIIRNINVYFPIQKEYDTIGQTSFRIEELGPGESVELFDEHKIRIKTNESFELEPTIVEYYDVKGTKMIKETDDETISVEDYKKISGPAIISHYQNQKIMATEGEKITSMLYLKNIGSETTTAKIYQNGQMISLKVPKNTEKFYDSTKYFTKEGEYKIDEALIMYEWKGSTYTTKSDSSVIYVAPKIEATNINEEIIVPSIKNLKQETQEEYVAYDVEKPEVRSWNKIILQLSSLAVLILLIITYMFYKNKKEMEEEGGVE